jgi:hypothetical protein
MDNKEAEEFYKDIVRLQEIWRKNTTELVEMIRNGAPWSKREPLYRRHNMIRDVFDKLDATVETERAKHRDLKKMFLGTPGV